MFVVNGHFPWLVLFTSLAQLIDLLFVSACPVVLPPPPAHTHMDCSNQNMVVIVHGVICHHRSNNNNNSIIIDKDSLSSYSCSLLYRFHSSILSILKQRRSQYIYLFILFGLFNKRSLFFPSTHTLSYFFCSCPLKRNQHQSYIYYWYSLSIIITKSI